MKQKQFCIECGREMTRRFVDMYFHPDDGSQHFNIIWRCPLKKWWNSHSKWKSDEDGSTYATEY